MKTVFVKEVFSVEESGSAIRHYPVGWRGPLNAKEADKQKKAGTVDVIGEDDSKEPSPPPSEELIAALHKVFAVLTPEEWGKDREPNIKVLKKGLKDLCDMSFPLRAADRDAALKTYVVPTETGGDVNSGDGAE